MPSSPRVLLFAGHRVDPPGRAQPRFPSALVRAAERAVARVLDTLHADAGDLALSQAAAGGDLIFSGACLDRHVALQWLLPLAEPQFIAQSVLPSADGDAWLRRYQDTRARLMLPVLEAPRELGPLPAGDDAFVRGNRWLLSTALATQRPLHFICLWDGGDGDGPGGTHGLMHDVRRHVGQAGHAGQLHWIDTRTLRA